MFSHLTVDYVASTNIGICRRHEYWNMQPFVLFMFSVCVYKGGLRPNQVPYLGRIAGDSDVMERDELKVCLGSETDAFEVIADARSWPEAVIVRAAINVHFDHIA